MSSAAFISSARTPRTLTHAEVKRLLAYKETSNMRVRNHALVALLLYAGLRLHEALALTHEQVFTEQGNARQWITLRVFKQTRQSDRPANQEAFFPRRLRSILESYRLWKRKESLRTDASAFLFASRQQARMTTRRARMIVMAWFEATGIEGANVHTLRHTCCSHLYAKTQDLRLVQQIARHADPKTTTIYTHVSRQTIEDKTEHFDF